MFSVFSHILKWWDFGPQFVSKAQQLTIYFICPSYLLTLVLLKFSSYSHKTFWRTFSVCLILPLQSGNFTSLPHTGVHSFSSVFPWCVCMNALPFIFILLLLIGQLCVDLLYPSFESLPKFSILSFKLEVKAQTSLFFLHFCAEVPEEKLKDLRVFVLTLLLYLLIC